MKNTHQFKNSFESFLPQLLISLEKHEIIFLHKIIQRLPLPTLPPDPAAALFLNSATD